MLAASCALGFVACPAHAVIVADGNGRNTTPPPEPYLDAWNLQGQFGSFLATPIDSRHVLAAAHTAGSPQSFFFQGHNYTLSTYTDVPQTDLRVWTLDTTNDPTLFPTWAPLWNPATDGSEIGHQMVVFGRGVTRGQAIYAPNSPGPTLTANYSVAGASVVPTSGVMTTAAAAASAVVTTSASTLHGPVATVPSELRGWTLGSFDGAQSWGRNVVDSIQSFPGLGKFLVYDFDRPDSPGAVANEGGLSPNDSGGGVFIQSGGVWKLAGINYGVDGIYAPTPDGVYSSAWDDGYTRSAIVDVSGLYTVPDDADTYPDVVQVGYGDDPVIGLLLHASDLPVGSQSFSTEVAPYAAYILSHIAGESGGVNGVGMLVPEPASVGLVAFAGLALNRRRRLSAACD